MRFCFIAWCRISIFFALNRTDIALNGTNGGNRTDIGHKEKNKSYPNMFITTILYQFGRGFDLFVELTAKRLTRLSILVKGIVNFTYIFNFWISTGLIVFERYLLRVFSVVSVVFSISHRKAYCIRKLDTKWLLFFKWQITELVSVFPSRCCIFVWISSAPNILRSRSSSIIVFSQRGLKLLKSSYPAAQNSESPLQRC